MPFWSAFNLHYALHWLLAALTLAALARALGQRPAAALVAGLAYAGSGSILTTSSFYNLLAVSAWWPLVLLGAVRGGRRGIALGGIACGLALLAGEPVTALLGIAPLLLVALQRHGPRRGLLTTLAIGGTGVLIALPNWSPPPASSASRRAARWARRRSAAAASTSGWRGCWSSPSPSRSATPGTSARRATGRGTTQPGLPDTLTLHFGVVALWLAFLGARKARGWALLAIGGLALAWAGALGGDALVDAVARPGALSREAPLLVRARRGPARRLGGRSGCWRRQRAWRGAAVGAGLALAFGGRASSRRGGRLAGWLAAGHVDPEFAADAARNRVGAWIVALLLAAALLALAAVAARRRSGAGLAAAQLAALLPLAGLVMTAPVADFAPSPWLARRRPRRRRGPRASPPARSPTPRT